MQRIIVASHENPKAKKAHLKRAWQLFRSLLDRKIIDLRWGQVRHGRRPSLEEIAASTGVDSTTVKRHISALGSTVPVAVDFLRTEAQRN
jgi:AraC-like DNA-binding protein